MTTNKGDTMLGTIVNTITILLGGGLGSRFGSKLSKRYSDILLQALALSVILMGLKSAIETKNILLLICCMALGSIIGEFLRIEERLDSISKLVERKFANHQGNIAEGFMTASLIYCVGSMAIIGAIESGVNNNHSTLFAKSILDGVSALVFSSTLGIGVALSALPVFIYQGSLTMLSGLLAGVLSVEAMNELSAVGGLLVMVIGLNILEVTDIKVGNMIPAVFLPVLYFMVTGFLL